MNNLSRKGNGPKVSPTPQGPLFSIRVISVASGAKPEAFFIVSKKIAPTAVERNKLKRRCRHAIRDACIKHTLRKSVIFYLNKQALAVPFALLKEEMEGKLRSLKVLI
jgi:ribonuclease P protein component